MQISILHVGVYRRVETNCQTTRSVFLGLHISGLISHRLLGADDRVLCVTENPADPALILIPENLKIDFQYGRRRENWVIQCRIPELQYRNGDSFSVIGNGEASFRLPLRQPIPLEKALRLREKFQVIEELFQTGLPEKIFAAELFANSLLAEMMQIEEGEKPAGMAEKFRAAIEADDGFRRNLAELSRELHASPGYLRKLFAAEYQLDPGEYRARLRLRRIMHLIEHTDLSLKEIAEQVGMRHVTHLHLFLRERCGSTPKLLLRHYRGG